MIRSASIKARLSIGESIDKVLSMAGVSKKVFSVFYDLPIGGVRRRTFGRRCRGRAVSSGSGTVVSGGAR